MNGYKDRVWCSESMKTDNKRCANYLCYRHLSLKERIEAERWWGGDDYPVVAKNLYNPACGYYTMEDLYP